MNGSFGHPEDVPCGDPLTREAQQTMTLGVPINSFPVGQRKLGHNNPKFSPYCVPSRVAESGGSGAPEVNNGASTKAPQNHKRLLNHLLVAPACAGTDTRQARSLWMRLGCGFISTSSSVLEHRRAPSYHLW